MRILPLLYLFASSLLHAQTVALTFDDGLDPRKLTQAREWNASILAALADAQVTAALFPAGRIVDSPQGLALVQDWSTAGHMIGNHTYSHGNYGSDQVSIDQFSSDILRQHGLLGRLPGWRNLLRFPYLKEGETVAKRDAIRRWLRRHGYRPAPVSIDTSDWYYDERYAAWLATRRGADSGQFRDAYLNHIWNRASYYDSLAAKVLKRRPSHVILLHTNQINAAFLSDMIAMFRTKGWKVIGPEEAFSDPLYRAKPRTLPAGESIIWALAKQHRVRGLRYPAEDGDYEEPGLNSLGL